MRTIQRAGLAAALVAVTFTAVAGAGGAQAAAPDKAPFTFAVIGDIPYGDDQIARFPSVVDQINADPAVSFVDHLGDIKSGSSLCSDSYIAWVRSQFDRFQDPLVYTPGDNEWTDCHRANNGAYNPYGRLALVRSTFFPQAGKTLGRKSVGVESQAAHGFVENVRYNRAGVAFAVPHIVGSNNGLASWSIPQTPAERQAQVDEVAARTQAAIDLIDATFDDAESAGLTSVVIMTQADMFDPTVPDPAFADYSAFAPIVATIVDRSSAFDGPVYLFNGDSHVFNTDHPLAAGSSWLSFYGVSGSADNLSRVTVDGSTGVDDYLRVSVRPDTASVLTVEKVPFTS
jgi:hypothetical protein